MRIPLKHRAKVGRTVCNLSCFRKTTLHPGLVTPVYFKDVVPGDKFIIDVNSLLQSQPMVAPTYGFWKLSISMFFEPLSNLYGFMDNNDRKSTDEIQSFARHSITIGDRPSDTLSIVDTKSIAVHGGSLLEYIGLPAGLTRGDTVTFCADRLWAYLDIWRTYFANNQQDGVPYFAQPWTGNNSVATFRTLQLDSLDYLFKLLRIQEIDKPFSWVYLDEDGVPNPLNMNRFPLVVQPSISVPAGTNYSRAIEDLSEYMKTIGALNCGLLPCQYQPDYFQNLLSTDVGKVQSTVTVVNGAISINQLRFANKVQHVIDDLDVSGGRFSDWVRSLFGVTPTKGIDQPYLIGTTSQVFDARTITAQSDGTSSRIAADGSTETTSTSLGEFAGNVDSFNRGRKWVFNANEYGILVGVVTLVPMVDYVQGIDPDLLRTDFADMYNPEMEQLAFQDVPRYVYSALPDVSNNSASDAGLTDVIGKQVAWLDFRTDWNRSYAGFGYRGLYDYWTLQRRFTTYSNSNQESSDPDWNGNFSFNRYINPLDWQYLFTGISYDYENWMLQLEFNIKAIRPISKQYMPTLGR